MNEILTVSNTISTALAVIMFFARQWVSDLQQKINELDEKNKAQDKVLQDIKLEIERDFTRKLEFKEFAEKVIQKLDKISEKLNEKADK